MNFHMRTTLIIDDAIFRELKRLAAEQRRTLSDITQEALRRGLAGKPTPKRRQRARLRSFALGRPRVDLADRNQLFDVLDRA
jgi:predicted transcriptional regulator